MRKKTINSCSRPRVSAAVLASDLKVVLENSVLAPAGSCVASDRKISESAERLRDYAYQQRPATQAETVIVITPEQLRALLAPHDGAMGEDDDNNRMVVVHFDASGSEGPGWYAFREGTARSHLLTDGYTRTDNDSLKNDPLFVRSARAAAGLADK